MNKWPTVPMADLFTIEKGKVGIKAAVPGKYPLVTTGERFLSHEEAHFCGDAVVIPMISATGHGHASIKRLHHIQGTFAVGSILCACVAKDENRVSARYAYLYLLAMKDALLVPLMQGSANVSLKLTDIATIEIPLPSLPEQRAIVAKLDELSDKTAQISAHMDAVEADADALIRTYLFGEQADGYEKRKMSELVSLRSTDVTVDSAQEYRFAGVYSFGRGVFASAVKSGSDFAYERLSTVNAGDFTYPKLMAWEGALGVVPPECDGMVVSPEFPVFTVNTDAVLPEVLDVYFRTPLIWPELAALSGGTNVRRRRLQPSNFLAYKMSVPPMSVQTKLRDLKMSVDALKAKHCAIRQSNTALLPATLERIFGRHRTPTAQRGETTDLAHHVLDKVKTKKPLTIEKMNDIASASRAGRPDDEAQRGI
ncbi:MAG: Type I restriction-modification system, specificity subunit S [uncultured Paraburkholderia sp.]|uniref:restriction endonuclease subunit S n=1 Tax=uncultured Paraburkholderia sp. TaxID=1822466 RepID=UPI0025991E2C|nr:restriction endonuclease subunit S [uncultured Paraburkholderia sp.]CAH2900322.1 MAG: Type I restriction-modification system, specificity subunit S [uncultured Paraburkholderia sp.]CAH2928642.1 MAG: Type I restriction-modification system, specificity subunit S [uncultured Paraburkholderia sp.]